MNQALGCGEITAISRKSNKKADALKMGATKFIATDEDEDWAQKNAKTLDLIICTVSSHNMPLSSYVDLLRIHGNLIMVGAPEDSLPGFNIFILIDKRAKIGGSAIGSPQQIRDMLNLAVRKQVHPWINVYPMQDANRAIVEFEEGKPRYRFVLQNNPGKSGLVQ
jgi:alcohol dehydrogenase (NADP+)